MSKEVTSELSFLMPMLFRGFFKRSCIEHLLLGTASFFCCLAPLLMSMYGIGDWQCIILSTTSHID
jgi:hypothetical protein